MKIVRFMVEAESRYGQLDEDTVKVIKGNIFAEYQVTDQTYPLGDCKLLPPCQPSKIFGVGLNYRDLDHYIVKGNPYPDIPGVFMIPPTGLIGQNDEIVYPAGLEFTLYEVELGVVMGKTAKSVKAAEALDYVFGYTCFNDISGYALPGVFAKGADTFSPMGPCIATDLDPADLALKTWVNGEIKQDSTTAQLLFTVPQIIEFITQYVTLLPGDVITTGSPVGVGELYVGDTVEIFVEGVGALKNIVVGGVAGTTGIRTHSDNGG